LFFFSPLRNVSRLSLIRVIVRLFPNSKSRPVILVQGGFLPSPASFLVLRPVGRIVFFYLFFRSIIGTLPRGVFYGSPFFLPDAAWQEGESLIFWPTHFLLNLVIWRAFTFSHVFSCPTMCPFLSPTIRYDSFRCCCRLFFLTSVSLWNPPVTPFSDSFPLLGPDKRAFYSPPCSFDPLKPDFAFPSAGPLFLLTSTLLEPPLFA